MPKKENPQRSAREIQTPASDRESDSPKPETPTTATGPTQKQHPKKKTAQFARSPTRKDDFAPGEIGDDYKSDHEADPDFENESEQDALIEDLPDPISVWAKEMIETETAKESASIVEEFFTAKIPDYDACEQFFKRLNQMIRAANKEHNVDKIDNGTIPETAYHGLCQTWRTKHTAAKESDSPLDAWEAFNTTHDLIKKFNKRYYLPKTQNISEAWAEKDIQVPNLRMAHDSDIGSLLGDGNQQTATLKGPTNVSKSKDNAIGLNELEDVNILEDLNALEVRTMSE